MLDRARPFSPLVIRAFLATFLIYMTQDNVFSAARMQEFVEFMTAEGFPAAAVLAPISVYAQFACGLLVAFGLLTRWAAAIMALTSSLPSSACTSELRLAHSLIRWPCCQRRCSSCYTVRDGLLWTIGLVRAMTRRDRGLGGGVSGAPTAPPAVARGESV